MGSVRDGFTISAHPLYHRQILILIRIGLEVTASLIEKFPLPLGAFALGWQLLKET